VEAVSYNDIWRSTELVVVVVVGCHSQWRTAVFVAERLYGRLQVGGRGLAIYLADPKTLGCASCTAASSSLGRLGVRRRHTTLSAAWRAWLNPASRQLSETDI